MSSELTKFYLAEAPDRRGRLITEIWRWDFAALEYEHDYIRWLFPLKVPSRFNVDAPILTAVDISAFHECARLRENLMRSLMVMLSFSGLEWVSVSGEIGTTARSGYFGRRAFHWITPGNHNFLRLTRIIASTTMLGLAAPATASCAFLTPCSIACPAFDKLWAG